MQILMTHPHCWPYVRRGTERNIDNLSRYLAARGHQVTLLSTLPKGGSLPVDGAIRQLLRRPWWTPVLSHLRVQPEHMFGLSTYFNARKLQAQVVHSFFYTDSLAASRARREKGWRTVLQLNGIAIPGISCRRFPPEEWLLRRAIEEADEFLVCSSFIQQLAQRHFGRAAKVMVPPIDIESWGLGHGPLNSLPSLLAVGDFEVPRKGIRVLLRAFERLREHEPEATLRISGRLSPQTASPLLAALSEKTRAAIEFLGLGQPGDLLKLYQEASLLVLPAMWEPSGTVMFEAMACGTPVAVTNHGGLPEFLTPEVGVLFEAQSNGEETDNSEGLVEAMRNGLALSRRPGVRERCRRHAENYSSASIGPRLEEIYAGR